MSQHATKIREQPGGAEVAAVIDDLLSLDTLFAAEAQWCLSRIEVLHDLSLARVKRGEWPESVHWNWAYKAAISEPSRLEAFGDVRLFGLQAAGQWQGLLFGLSEGHFTRQGVLGRPLVYVDFLESAPWNWTIEPLDRVGKYRGIGGQLMELAVRWSLSLGYAGRVGLHSLPQASGFYNGRCGMTDLGPDINYDSLCYFELTESDAEAFLRRTS
ncbi:MAG: hypothetical protein M3O30_17965 [Planctomycetota bacterium]|nr:hypothetical protein [Planctomycetota bacterium]